MESARAATAADLPALAELAAALRAELREQRGGALWSLREARPEPLATSLGTLLDRDDACVVVGVIDGTVVGFGEVEIETLSPMRRAGVDKPLSIAYGTGELPAMIAGPPASDYVDLYSFIDPDEGRLTDTRFVIEEVDPGDTPTSFLDVVGHEVEPQHLQWHTRTGSPNAPGARPAAVHGYGEGEDDVEPEIRKFLARVDEGIRRFLGASEAPLLLAGPDPLPALFRDASSYPHLVERGKVWRLDHLAKERALKPVNVDVHHRIAPPSHFGPAKQKGAIRPLAPPRDCAAQPPSAAWARLAKLVKPGRSRTARSASTLRSISIPAVLRPWIIRP